MKTRALLLPPLALLAAMPAALGAANQQLDPAAPSTPGPSEPAGPREAGVGKFFLGRGELDRRSEVRADPSAQAESVIRRYPLGALLPEVDFEERTLPLFVGAPISGGWEHSALGADDVAGSVDADVVADLIAQALDDDLRFEGRALQVVEGPALMLMAPEAVHEKAQAILDGLAQVLAARAVITVDVLTESEGQLAFPAGALVSDQEAQQLVASALAQGAQHVRHELSASSGSLAISDQSHPLELVADYDVEIAQHSAIWDPVTSTHELGQRVYLSGSVVDGAYRMAGVVLTSELVGEVEERALDAAMLLTNEKTGVGYGSGPRSIQQAEFAQSAYAFRGVVGSGRALVCASEAAVRGKRRTQLVVVRATEVVGSAMSRTPVGGAGREVLVVDTKAFSTSRLAAYASSDQQFGGTVAPVINVEMRDSVPDFLYEFIDFRFSVNREYGPWRMILTDPAWDRNSPEDLERFVAAWPAPGEGMSLSLDLAASGRADAIAARGLVPALPGLASAVVVGASRNMLWDYDVEVAQHAAVADPTVSQLFTGLGALVTVEAGAGGTREVRAEAYGCAPEGPRTVFEVDAKEFKYFDRQDRDLLIVNGRRTLGQDGAASFGARAMGTPRQVLQLRASVR